MTRKRLVLKKVVVVYYTKIGDYIVIHEKLGRKSSNISESDTKMKGMFEIDFRRLKNAFVTIEKINYNFFYKKKCLGRVLELLGSGFKKHLSSVSLYKNASIKFKNHF